MVYGLIYHCFQPISIQGSNHPVYNKVYWTIHIFVQVDKIIDQLQLFIQTFDLNGLKDYWGYLDRRLFCRLEDIYRPTVSKLRTSLFRYYVVYTVQVHVAFCCCCVLLFVVLLLLLRHYVWIAQWC